MKYFVFALVSILLIGMEACNSSSTPSTPADYFKGIDKIGNYWVYKNQEIDTNGVLQSSFYIDSTWINGVMLVEGKQANQMISHVIQDSSESYDTTYVYRDVNKVFLYTAFSGNMFDTAAPTKKWTLIADLNATAPWSAVDTIKIDQEQALGGFTLIFKLMVYGSAMKKNDTTIVAANGTSYKTKCFGIQPVVSGTISAKGLPLSQNVTMTGGQTTEYFADGLALIQQRQEPAIINVGDGSFFPPQKSPGSLRSLLRYHVQ